MTIKNIILNAERHYDSFINQANDWNFFLGLAEYVKFVSEEKVSEKIIIEAMDKGKARLKDLSELSEKSIVEMNNVFEKIVGIIKQDKLDFFGLSAEIKEYEDHKNGLIYSSSPLPFMLFEALADIISILVRNNYIEKIKNYVELRAEPGEGRQYYIKKYTFSNEFLEYEKANKLFNDKRDIEIWGVWDNLVMVYNSVFKKEELITELDKDRKNFWQAFNARGVIGELNSIKEGKSDDRPVYFKKQDFMAKASRFHNYLIKELNKLEETASPAMPVKIEKSDKIFFDFNSSGIPTGKLYVGNFSIEFQKMPAKIINYFFVGRKFFSNGYKNYKDFNEYIKEDNEAIKSDDFSKRINEINDRVGKETKGFVKELLEKELRENKGKQTANSYRFNTKL